MLDRNAAVEVEVDVDVDVDVEVDVDAHQRPRYLRTSLGNWLYIPIETTKQPEKQEDTVERYLTVSMLECVQPPGRCAEPALLNPMTSRMVHADERLVERTRMIPVVDSSRPMSELPHALQAMREGAQTGKLVLVNEWSAKAKL